jgi:hypothetical protein
MAELLQKLTHTTKKDYFVSLPSKAPVMVVKVGHSQAGEKRKIDPRSPCDEGCVFRSVFDEM